MIECDVLVVGAGPAGSSAARAAAVNGAKTIIIDKKEEVGVPVQCAEGIGKYLFPYLPFKIPKSQLKWKIDGVIFWAEGITIERVGEIWDGYTIDRKKFDKWLSKLAINAGATIWTNAELTDLELDKENNVKKAIIKTPKKTLEIKPKVLIAADGAESSVSKLIGVYKPDKESIADVYSWEMKNLELSSPNLEQIFLGDFAPKSYGYIFPTSKTSANIGVGSSKSRVNITDCFSDFLELDIVKKQTKNADFVLEKHKNAVIGDLIDEWAIGNILFCGDAANHNLKPFIEGILPAIVSGNIAGELVAKICYGYRINHSLYFDKLKGILSHHFDYSKEISDLCNRIFLIDDKKKRNLLLAALLSQLYELEHLEILEDISIESIESKFLEAKSNQ